MTDRASSEWLGLLAGGLGCSPAFREAMDEQLADEALERAGIDVHRGFVLVPVAEPFEPRYNARGVGFVEADLVGPDGWGEPVVVAWADPETDERVKPDSPLGPSDACRLRVWWHDFPEETLRSRYGNAPEPLDLSTEFPFEVWTESPAWPDVWLELRTERHVESDVLQQSEVVLKQRRSAWNDRPAGGIIHDASEIERLDDERLQLHVDFGSAGEAALTYWLEALAASPLGTAVTEVYVRGFPV